MKQRNFRSLAIVAGLALAGGSAYAQNVKIAYIDPLSGPFANVGEAGLKGFKEFRRDPGQPEGRHDRARSSRPSASTTRAARRKARSSSRRRSTRALRFITQGNGSGAAHC
jgi:branched-chain amino acid transport system substrate-binding protein